MANATDESVLAKLGTVAGLSDSAAADALNVQERTSLPPLTYRNLANRVGLVVSGAFTETVVAAAASSSADPLAVQLRRLALLCERVLANDGLDPDASHTPAVVEMVVAAGWLSESQAENALWSHSYPCGGTVTAEQVARVRAAAARQATFDALRHRAMAGAAHACNELLTNAQGDPPSWAAVVAAIGTYTPQGG